jgi:hypothetical protein
VTNLELFLTNQPTKECHLFIPKVVMVVVVVVDLLLLSSKSSFHGPKLNLLLLQPIRACHNSCF